MDTQLIQTFLLVPTESTLISMHDNMVVMTPLVRTFVYYRPVSQSQHYMLHRTENCAHNHDPACLCMQDLCDSHTAKTAVVWSSCHEHALHQIFYDVEAIGEIK